MHAAVPEVQLDAEQLAMLELLQRTATGAQKGAPGVPPSPQPPPAQHAHGVPQPPLPVRKADAPPKPPAPADTPRGQLKPQQAAQQVADDKPAAPAAWTKRAAAPAKPDKQSNKKSKKGGNNPAPQTETDADSVEKFEWNVDHTLVLIDVMHRNTGVVKLSTKPGVKTKDVNKKIAELLVVELGRPITDDQVRFLLFCKLLMVA